MVGLIFGVAVAIWTASNYVGAFIRASNAIYERDEGRPFWKLRPIQLLLTLVLVLIAALVVLALIITGPVAEAVGDAVGLGDAAVTAWNIAKWPVMLVVVMLMLAILYWSAPNAKVYGFRWVSPGSIVAVVLWIVGLGRFAFYVGNFGSYNKTYGALAGVIVFLVWMWITNIAVLLGAELNAETERARELEVGIPGAEEDIKAPYRDVPKEERERAGRADAQLSCAARRCRADMRALVLIVVWVVIGVVAVRSWPDAGAAATGSREISAETRAATLRFAPEVKPSDRAWILAAIQKARPEAQRLIAEIDGLVEIRTDLPRGEAIGLAQMTLDDAVVNFDTSSLNGDRAFDRDVVVLHELGHVVDFQLVDDGWSELDRGIPRVGACHGEGLPVGACTAVEERFADTFAKWALRGRVSLAGSGYGIPAPTSIEDWGAPLGLLAAQLNTR